MNERFESIKKVLPTFLNSDKAPVYVIEGIIIFLLIYYVIKVLNDNGAKRFIVAYSLIILTGCVLAVLSPGISLELFVMFIMLLSMFFLLTYNIEIKRGLTSMKKIAGKSNFESEGKTQQQTEDCIAGIIKAVQNMSKKNTGALIVLANKNIPGNIVRSGVILDADISSQLIEGIFINKAPLHDGAMIIDGHKIRAAGCFLPLTQKTDLSSEYGTRHRAAIGVTENCEVVAIVVSEETGVISVAREKDLKRYVTSQELRDLLKEYYWSGLDDGKKKKKEETHEEGEKENME